MLYYIYQRFAKWLPLNFWHYARKSNKKGYLPEKISHVFSTHMVLNALRASSFFLRTLPLTGHRPKRGDVRFGGIVSLLIPTKWIVSPRVTLTGLRVSLTVYRFEFLHISRSEFFSVLTGAVTFHQMLMGISHIPITRIHALIPSSDIILLSYFCQNNKLSFVHQTLNFLFFILSLFTWW